jgi:aspartyl-tRNA(Asn)/glutamyl-tRNA(Gln) amidotransferase subunit B
MFCCSKNDAEETRPNVNVCPVCMAHPGTLPVINREAVRSVLRVGAALGSRLADYTEFDRKNYFYPDLPKGYQLSQYEYPLVEGGALAGVRLTRIHLEEDTASSMHDDATGTTVIDYNRAGVPLMELVTEPVIKSAEEAGRFARELQLLLRYLGVSEANMEKGQMRVEANVSVGPEGKLGTKVEIKNLNSFNAMERAVRYEIERQTALLEKGETVAQQTLGWDEKRQATFAQRSKEGSADYRYFPDPDLPSLKLSELEGYDAESLRSELPELPSQRRERYLKAGVQAEDAELYVRDVRFGDFFDAVSEGLSPEAARIASNYLANDVVKLIRDIETRDSVLLDKMPFSSDAYRALIGMVAAKKVSSKAAKELLLAAAKGEDPEAYASAHGLLQQKDPQAIERAISGVLSEHETVAADYRAGKAAALEFLLGRAMKELRGAADPMQVREALKKKLG